MIDTFASPPRRVRLRPGLTRLRVIAFRAGTLPFLAAGLLLLAMVLQCPLTLMFGVEVTGRVEQVAPHAKYPDQFEVTYTYDRGNGIHLVGYDRVDPKDVLAPKVGQSFPVRVLVLGSYTHPESVIGDKGGYVCMGCFATVWCGFVGLFSVVAWRGPAREKRFLETGRVVAGTISSKKQTGSGRSTKLAVTYVYKAFDGVKRGGVAYVGPEMFEMIQEGQQVTVIYRLDRPPKSMLYEASDYEIVNGAS